MLIHLARDVATFSFIIRLQQAAACGLRYSTVTLFARLRG
jgi:hypothetical protein